MYIKEPFVSLSATDKFGIDKLHISTDQYQVDDITPWNIKPNIKKAGELTAIETPLFVSNGEIINGAGAYVNQPTYTAEIKYGRLHIQFNPSKQYHPYHLTTNQDKLAETLKFIETDLKAKLCTDADLFSSGISRMDLTAQQSMRFTTPSYDQVIKGSRSLKRAPKTEYPHGFLIGNLTRKLCTYDKGLKLQLDQGFKVSDPTNLLRVETRNLKASAIKDHTPFKNTIDILTAKPGQFELAYSNCLNALLKIDQAPINFIELNALTDLLITTKQTYPRQWLMFSMMILSRSNSMPTTEQFEQALIPLVHLGELSRTSLWRAVKDYQSLLHKTKLMQTRLNNDSTNNYIDLHKEFKDQFILPYKIV